MRCTNCSGTDNKRDCAWRTSGHSARISYIQVLCGGKHHKSDRAPERNRRWKWQCAIHVRESAVRLLWSLVNARTLGRRTWLWRRMGRTFERAVVGRMVAKPFLRNGTQMIETNASRKMLGLLCEVPRNMPEDQDESSCELVRIINLKAAGLLNPCICRNQTPLGPLHDITVEHEPITLTSEDSFTV